ncbi:MAG: sensor histidine kinase [Frankiales bacterium]|nr:sensor histidine kinase [Frankiales bacterium]
MPATDRWANRAGVRLRATTIATLVVAVALAAGGIVLVLLVHRSLVGSVDAAGKARAHDVAALATSNRLQGTVASTGEESSVVQVITARGEVIAASANIGGEPALLSTAPGHRSEQVLALSGLPIADSGQTFRVVAEPVQLPTGPGWVYVATSVAQIDLTTARLAVLLVAGLPLLLLVVAAATWRAVGRALRPVEQIRSSAASISGTEPGVRVPVPATKDEIARLALTMNAMLARIESSALRQREFVGDASHELRSPLAALQTEIDVAVAHPSDEPTPQLLARMSGQTARMGQLLDGLLILARAEEGAAEPGHAPVDLDELVLAEAARLRSAGSTVTLTGTDAARIQGSGGDLTRLLRNLGDNAATHAHSTITLSLHVHAGEALLTVADDGPGIPEADRERIFERFTRLDHSRSRTASGGGAGLGLAICRQIAQRHGGQISLEAGPGARFVVRLPLMG